MAARSADDVVDTIASAVPDLMNDHQYATNLGSGEDGTGDADTCRICRGEATEEEPLFYPCKCSGSIKFVHQDCLMEWLSHSQKKHCELCKTPFRFTKLYSPNMPQSLPNHVFIRHLLIHTVKNLTIWLRFCLVVFVWLGCLPWAMRHIWGFLFWFGDGGWTLKDLSLSDNNTAQALEALALARERLASLSGNGTSPANPLMTMPTSSAAVGTIMQNLEAFLRPVAMVNPWQWFTWNSWPESSTFGLLKVLGFGAPLAGVSMNNTNTSLPLNNHPTEMRGRPSLLSDVSFLKALTRNQRVNDIIITALEGQIITIVVVVCFVLVFLIREWVVQQQPGINMGAVFNGEFGADRVVRNRNVPPDNVPDVERQVVDAARNLENAGNAGNAVQRQALDVAARPIARPRRRIVRFEEVPGNDLMRALEDRGVFENVPVPGQERETEDFGEVSAGGNQGQRPDILARSTVSPAADIQRHITDDSAKIQDRFDAGEFVSVWRRAGGNPEEVLRIIEAEGLGERLRYWKNAMIGLQASSSTALSPGVPSSTNGMQPRTSISDILAEQHTETTNSSSASWVDIPAPLNVPEHLAEYSSRENQTNDALSYLGEQKGKGKANANDTSNDSLFETTKNSVSAVSLSGPPELWNREAPSGHQIHAFPERSGFKSEPGRHLQALSNGHEIRENTSPLAEHDSSFTDFLKISPTATIPGFSSNLSEGASWKTERDLRKEENVQSMDQGVAISEAGNFLTESTAFVELPGITSDNLDLPIEVYNPEKGTTQIAQSWDEVFAHNPISDSEDDFEDHPANAVEPEPNPFHHNGLLPDDRLIEETRDPAPARQLEVQGFWGHIANFLWGDVEAPEDGRGGDDEHIVQDIAAEAPFVPVAHQHNHGIFRDDDSDDDSDDEEELNQGRDVLAAAALAAGIDPNDPDGLDDAEDFEGIMELVGMRGPLTALVQNGLFSAVLISLTVACGVWMPYNVGRLVLLLIANPIPTVKLPLKLVFSCAAVLQDVALVALGILSYMAIRLGTLPSTIYFQLSHRPRSSTTAIKSLHLAQAAGERITEFFINSLLQIPDSEVPAFSAVSHESLIYIKTTISNGLQYVCEFLTSRLATPAAKSTSFKLPMDLSSLWATVLGSKNVIGNALQSIQAFMTTTESWVISLDIPDRITPVDPSLSYWNGTDRFWAILAGYVAFCFLGAAYLRKGSPFSTSQTGRELEATIIDVLHQAGGVMKVILIISIEMLVFPLYCGLLLDLALLPLFENATVLSRLHFTRDSPLTSIFVHWFVGTCYMFHFALFVSMCRKIMRSGVLYFIRDPDDPTFHPVRDVLERNVITQLRKITFSALVYGALVVICLGGVVWGLAFTFPGVLPIHWSSNEPVLEFPIDLLFYNFFMPLAVKFFKPSDGLHTMYTWWFQKCARILRLTWFLFDERKIDEEGHHVRRSWLDIFQGAAGDPMTPIKYPLEYDPFKENSDLRAYFLRDGMFVRAPASDQVRIPKGGKVFLEVDENNDRIDGCPDNDDGLHGRTSEHFKLVYVPPHFRGRIFLFILSIWIFAAVTGVCITIVPLVFGRQIFARIIPAHVRKNDVYAFSIGIYILGSILYCAMRIQQGIEHARTALSFDAETPVKVFHKLSSVGLRILRLVYAYTAFAIVLPTLFAFAVEFYFIIPLHTYVASSEPHVIHFVQSWTLGLLYVKLTTRFILWHADSRPAEALRAVTRKGYLDPDIRIATRAFIFPAASVLMAALVIPFSVASFATRCGLFVVEEEQKLLVFRYAYPFCLSMVITMIVCWLLLEALHGWRMRIRDEVYLIGERLHNFGDRNKSGTAALMPTGTRLDT